MRFKQQYIAVLSACDAACAVVCMLIFCCRCVSLFVLISIDVHCESKKRATILLSVTSPNVDRFSQFFH